MPNREEIHNCAETLVLATTTTTGVTTTPSIDCDGFDSAHFTIATNTGTVASGMTYKITESDDNSTFTDAPTTSVVDDGSTLTASKAKRVAYVGNKRYAKLELTPAASTVFTVFAHRGYAANKPVSNPI